MYQGRSFKNSPLALAICAALLSQTAIADDHSDAHETVVVTGNPLAATDVFIDAKQLEERQANDINDIFRSDAEVSVGGGSGVSQKIYVRGIESTNLNVSIDGAVQSGNIYHHQGNISIEPDLLKEVEVIAGAGRATDGAGALGGAIRFETKDAEDLLLPGQRFGASAKAGYYTNTEGFKTTVSGYGYLTDDISAVAMLSYLDQDNFQDGDGEEQAHTGAETKVGFLKVVGNVTDAQKVTLSYDTRKDEAHRFHRPQWIESVKNSAIDQEMDRETLTAKYNLNPQDNDWLDLRVTAYHTDTRLVHVDGPYGDSDGEMKSVGGDIRNTTKLGAHALIYGIDYRQDKGSMYNTGDGFYDDEGDVTGVYIQGDFVVTDKFIVSAGGRYDSYDVTEADTVNLSHDGFSPNVSANYSLTKNLSVFAGYAEAFKGAQVREIYNIAGSKSAEDRKAERAKNTELGASWASGGFSLSATAYFSEIEDVVGKESGELTNVGDLKDNGFNVRAGYNWDNLSLGLGYNQSRPELNDQPLRDDEDKGVGTSIGDTWVASVNYMFSEDIEFGYSGRFVERLDDVADGFNAKAGYAVHDIYGQWTPISDKNLVLSVAVKNLFDKAYRDHASYGEYIYEGTEYAWAKGTKEPGRDIRFNVAYAF